MIINTKKIHRLAITFLLLIILSACSKSPDNLSILGKGKDHLLFNYLIKESNKLFQKRKNDVSKAMKSPKAISARQKKLKKDLMSIVGPFPKKTPLNAKITGVIQCDGYKIEKVVYESYPGLHVTANLYMPTIGNPPFPGVIVPCGHSFNGKAFGSYQKISILLAKNGIAALVYDPIGQGERFQFLTDKGERLASTGRGVDHTLIGAGALLVGLNTTNYFLWDGIRSIEYLQTRKEIDSKRIGCTGNSGGGAITTFMMAVDERIYAAAPSCYITTLERLFVTAGLQDTEQHLQNQGLMGIEHADFITIRAPKPTRILAAEKGFFDIKGTRESFKEAMQVYKLFGKPEQVDMFSYNDEHGFSKPRREKSVEWMRQWFFNDTSKITEGYLVTLPEESLMVTKTGQVLTEWKGKRVQDLNLDRANKLASERKRFWAQNSDKCISEVQHLIGFQYPKKSKLQKKGILSRKGYSIRKLIIKREDGFPIPALLYIPKLKEKKNLPATILVDSRGKHFEDGKNKLIEKLLEENQIVLSIDVRGFGETLDLPLPEEQDPHDVNVRYRNREYRITMLSFHIGRPILGQRVEDVLASLDVLLSLEIINANKISLYGIELGGPVVLHAAAIEGGFNKVSLHNSIRSWIKDVVAKPLEQDQLSHTVPVALTKYDLPDLMNIIGNDKVFFIN